MRKIIGLIPLFDDKRTSYWMLPGYMKMIEECGGFPIMLPLTTDQKELSQCLSICDGIIFTGGQDIDPALYHSRRIDECGVCCKERDKMEAYLFESAMFKDIPVLGICRGIQLMNVMLGGTLYQDLKKEHPSTVDHHMQAPYDRPVHIVNVYEHTILSNIMGAGCYPVNSYHHQAIRDIAQTAEVMAVSDDGLIESISVPGQRFAVGVQWHPEFIYNKDEKAKKLIQAFLDACYIS